MTNEDAAKYREEAKAEIGSPYRMQLYITARGMGYSKEKALKAAKDCDPKVVKKFEKGG